MGGGVVTGVGVASQVALVVKKPPTRAGDGRGDGSDPWVRGRGNPPQCSAWRPPGERGAWRATVHGITKRHD